MKRLAPYLGIVAAVVLVVCIAQFRTAPTIVRTLVVPAAPRETVATSTTPQKITPPVASGTAAVTLSTEEKHVRLARAATQLERALVNIICYVPPGSGLRSMTGSGVIIGSKGVILTNAHIGQYFLLANRGVSCMIRSGSPAVDRYRAELAYISPIWLVANPTVLTQAAPRGTGQYDFALLAITSGVGSAVLPENFPFISLATAASYPGAPVAIAAYAAQSLQTKQIQSSLLPTVVTGSVRDVFTFATNSVDVLTLDGSAAAQEGSSGGGVANMASELVGTITTSSEGVAAGRSLSAITAFYIRAAYLAETGSSLDTLLTQSPTAVAEGFKYRIPALESIITAQLR